MHFVKGYKSKERALSTGMEQNKNKNLQDKQQFVILFLVVLIKINA